MDFSENSQSGLGKIEAKYVQNIFHDSTVTINNRCSSPANKKSKASTKKTAYKKRQIAKKQEAAITDGIQRAPAGRVGDLVLHHQDMPIALGFVGQVDPANEVLLDREPVAVPVAVRVDSQMDPVKEVMLDGEEVAIADGFVGQVDPLNEVMLDGEEVAIADELVGQVDPINEVMLDGEKVPIAVKIVSEEGPENDNQANKEPDHQQGPLALTLTNREPEKRHIGVQVNCEESDNPVKRRRLHEDVFDFLRSFFN